MLDTLTEMAETYRTQQTDKSLRDICQELNETVMHEAGDANMTHTLCFMVHA